jgi:hypothetical protein
MYFRIINVIVFGYSKSKCKRQCSFKHFEIVHLKIYITTYIFHNFANLIVYLDFCFYFSLVLQLVKFFDTYLK